MGVLCFFFISFKPLDLILCVLWHVLSLRINPCLYRIKYLTQLLMSFKYRDTESETRALPRLTTYLLLNYLN